MTKEPSYQLLRLRRKKQESLKEALEIADELARDPTLLEYKALVIMMLPFSQVGTLVKYTGYSRKDILTIYSNWSNNGMWKDKKLVVQEFNDEFEQAIAFVLAAMVGAGKLKAVEL